MASDGYLACPFRSIRPWKPMRAAITRYEAAHLAMGTEFTLVAYGDDPQYLTAVGNEVFEEIDQFCTASCRATIRH